jgi:hypothetical protein
MKKGINGRWTSAAPWRCHGKKRYQSFEQATRAAERRSKATGDLIISYQCPDCLFFHIGHADRTQILARQSDSDSARPSKLLDLPFEAIARAELGAKSEPDTQTSTARCLVCGYAIPKERVEAAMRSGNGVRYCTSRCARIAKARRRSARKGPSQPSTGESRSSEDSRPLNT